MKQNTTNPARPSRALPMKEVRLIALHNAMGQHEDQRRANTDPTNTIFQGKPELGKIIAFTESFFDDFFLWEELIVADLREVTEEDTTNLTRAIHAAINDGVASAVTACHLGLCTPATTALALAVVGGVECMVLTALYKDFDGGHPITELAVERCTADGNVKHEGMGSRFTAPIVNAMRMSWTGVPGFEKADTHEGVLEALSKHHNVGHAAFLAVDAKE